MAANWFWPSASECSSSCQRQRAAGGVRRGNAHRVGLHAAEEHGSVLSGAVSATPCPSSIDETYHRVEVPVTTGSSVVMRSASASHGTASENWDTSPWVEGLGLCLVGPEVQVCLLLLVGAEGDVVDVRLAWFRAVGEGDVGEPVALVVRQPRGQPDRPGACGLHQRARNPGEERASRHVDGVLDGCRRVCHEVDQLCARGRDEQCEVDACGADARPRRPVVGGCRRAVGVEGELRDGDGRVEQRVPVDPPPGVGVGEPDGDAEDVGAVAGGGPVGVDVRAAWRRPAGSAGSPGRRSRRGRRRGSRSRTGRRRRSGRCRRCAGTPRRTAIRPVPEASGSGRRAAAGTPSGIPSTTTSSDGGAGACGVTACHTVSTRLRPMRIGRSARSTNDMTSTYGLSARVRNRFGPRIPLGP